MTRGIYNMSKKVGFLLICMAVLILAGTACAERFSITATAVFGKTEVSVHSRYVNEKYTLYIPGNWDLSSVYIEMTAQDRIRVGETEIVSGQMNDLTACLGKKQPFYNAKGRRMSGALTILQGSSIPSLYLDMEAKELSQVNKNKHYVISAGTVKYIEKDGNVSYDGRLSSFKGRGNSTFAYSKKPYQLKLSRKADFSGMGKGKTWLLIANWLDLSLLRNEVSMQLSRQIGMQYALDCQMADVYINGNYQGLYLITEKVQIGENRINITNLEDATNAVNKVPVENAENFKETKTEGLQMLRGYEIAQDPEDITGGYILEIEKSHRFSSKIANGFRTANGISVTVKEPTYASRSQVTYIGRLVSDFHKAALAEDGYSPDTGRYYADFINMDSWALKWWVEEISKNYDAMASSQFFYKDSDRVDPLLYAGPCWDYDLSMGNMYAPNFIIGTMPTRDYVAVYSTKPTNLYRALYLHEDFKALLKQMYRERVRPALAILMGETDAGTGDSIHSFDAYAAEIEASSEMNFTRWPESTVNGYYKKSGTTHEKSLAFVKNFLQVRMEYLDSVWLQ